MGKRIGINLVFLNPERAGGAETYVRALVREYGEMELGGRVVLFVGRGHGLEVDRERFEVVECDVDPRRQYWRIIWEQTHLPAVLDRHRLDVVHFPYSAYSVRYGGECVVSIHDTTRFVSPRGVPRAQTWYRRVMEGRLGALGHRVIAVSHSDAGILKDRLGLSEGQVSVVYHGVGEGFRVGRPFEGERKYLLWVGRVYEHKRVETLVEAYGLLVRRMGGGVPLLRLVGVGAEDRTRVEGWASKAGVQGRVSIEGAVGHGELARVYREAAALVFPSSYESFGLPVLEAMASGTAVVCSDIAVFQEVYGGVAEMTRVGEAKSLADGMERVLRDDVRRKEMERAGIERARGFSWRACAAGTMKVVAEAGRSEGGDRAAQLQV